jgi:dihydrofolate reductase
MRRVIYLAQLTLDGRIAKADETFWEPMPIGDPEQAWTNDLFRAADTWALGRRMFDVIVPWWDQVAAGELPEDAGDLEPAFLEFAQLLRPMTKAVFSRSLTSDRPDVRPLPDAVEGLRALRDGEGPAILLSCGPQLFGELVQAGLVDELALTLHPAVITNGKRLFDGLRADLALRTLEVRPFAAGATGIRYAIA